MAAALPHTGREYSFARTTMGPCGGFSTGIAENIEFILAPAGNMFFMGAYLPPGLSVTHPTRNTPIAVT